MCYRTPWTSGPIFSILFLKSDLVNLPSAGFFAFVYYTVLRSLPLLPLTPTPAHVRLHAIADAIAAASYDSEIQCLRTPIVMLFQICQQSVSHYRTVRGAIS